MAKIIRHDYSGIQDALNKMIIAEVKAALELLPEKCIREEGHSLCRIIIGPADDYSPRNVAVDEVWVDDKDKLLHIYGRDLTVASCLDLDQNVQDTTDPEEWTEEDSLYDITDFGYLIEQIAQQAEGDGTVNLPNESLLTAGYVTEWTLKQAADKTVTV